jgi:HD-GYP domain-containing protein (c-di-GMP phosphodiesterase class II)
MIDHETDTRDAAAAVDADHGTGGGRTDAEPTGVASGLGQQVIRCLFSASKTLQIHDLNNHAAKNVLSALMEVLERVMEIDGRVGVRVMTDFLYLNDARVPVDPMNFGLFLYLIEEMKKRNVEQIDVLPGIETDELGRSLKLFFGDASAGDSFGDLERALTGEGIEHVKIYEWMDRQRQLQDTVIEEPQIREESNKVFFRAVLFMAEVLKSIEQRRVIQVRKAERMAQQICDILRVDESILVGLANIKSVDEYTYTHSVNVCILSMLVGDRLNLHKAEVARLGVAALLHDVGKTYIPRTILNKPEKLSPDEWELMKLHTMFGVKELSRVKSLREIADSLFVSLEHHIQYNMNGYPQRPGGWNLPLFSRIVTIADYYDAMTSIRIYHREPLTPDKAIRFVFEKSGSVFDPLLAKVFINAMGIFPNGTVVELDGGEQAVVARQNSGPTLLHRPIVVPLEEHACDDWEKRQIDLAERSTDGTGYRRSIVRALSDAAAEQMKSRCFTAS